MQNVPRCARLIGLALLTAAAAAGCDKAQLLAPTNSTITVSAPTKFLPPGGAAEITAFVLESAGTPVQNGTTVRFSSTLGSVSPVETQTRNGLALTTFTASNSSGIATIRASSGAASGGTDNTNLVEITVGAAAVNTVTIRANPGSVGPGGGSVELIATVVGENGQALSGIGVTFNTDQGTIASPNVITNDSGEARTTLTTAQQTVVSATAGTKTSSNVTITVRSAPIISLACAPTSGSGNCSAVQASANNNTAGVLFTVTRSSSSSALRTATIDFGDGNTQSLGNLAGGTATISHTYDGPSGSNSRSYTATVQVTDINGESASVSTTVTITPRARLTVSLTATLGTAVATVGRPVTFEATATSGSDIKTYEWDFGDGSNKVETTSSSVTRVYTTNGTKIVTVTVTTGDGRTASGRVEFIVSGI